MKKTSPWAWIGSLYFIEGLPNAVVASSSVAFYKSMGMSNQAVAMLTGAMYLPWALKGLWGPLVDSFSTKRRWILFCAAVFSACFVGLCGAVLCSDFVGLSAAIFWILAVASATFDIAADGFYMLSLDSRGQSFFVGIRNGFYRVAVLYGQGAMVLIAGWGERSLGSLSMGWALAFSSAALISILALIQFTIILPTPQGDSPRRDSRFKDVLSNIYVAFLEFAGKKDILTMLAFIMLYRFSESQLVKMAQPFMLDPRDCGGLGLSLSTVGVIYGTVSPVLLLTGGILGGFWVARVGLKKALMPMCLAMNLPNALYAYMAIFQPQQLWEISLFIGFEQFGYGFGFSGYMVYLMIASRGNMQTSTYAICTSFMALALAIPSMLSGYVQKFLGSYENFFIWVFICTIPSIFATWLVLPHLRED